MMKKKKTKTQSNPAKENMVANQPQKQNDAPLTEEKPFDFGGLPNRDLKKNLGCG